MGDPASRCGERPQNTVVRWRSNLIAARHPRTRKREHRGRRRNRERPRSAEQPTSRDGDRDHTSCPRRKTRRVGPLQETERRQRGSERHVQRHEVRGETRAAEHHRAIERVVMRSIGYLVGYVDQRRRRRGVSRQHARHRFRARSEHAAPGAAADAARGGTPEQRPDDKCGAAAIVVPDGARAATRSGRRPAGNHDNRRSGGDRDRRRDHGIACIATPTTAAATPMARIGPLLRVASRAIA